MKGIVSIRFCCNDDNGSFNGSFCAVHIGDDLLELDNRFWPPKEPTLKYNFTVTAQSQGFGASRVAGNIEVNGRPLPVIGYKYGWGNWCWDLVIMTPEVAVDFLNFIKGLDVFSPDAGVDGFFDTFSEAGAVFNESHLPELSEHGYSRP